MSSSHAVRKSSLSPTTALVAWLIANGRESTMDYTRLGQMLFLLDWKLVQARGTPVVEHKWIHDNDTVTAVGLFARLCDDGHFVLTDRRRPEAARISLARPLEEPLDADIARTAGPQFRFLVSQGPSALKKMIRDSFPVRGALANRQFSMAERFTIYTSSRKADASA